MPMCHTGNPVVFVADGITVHGGGNMRNGAWQNMDSVPDVAIGPEGVLQTRSIRDSVPMGWSCADAFNKTKLPKFVVIDWPDYSIPTNAGKEFWVALVNDLREHDVKTVSCSCAGGHGRTGVQLCILAHLMLDEKQWEDVAGLIDHIRSVYCTHAVETHEQQLYIADVTGLEPGENLFTGVDSHGFGGFSFEDMDYDEDDDEALLDELRKASEEAKKKKNTKNEYKGKFQKGMVLLGCPTCDNSDWYESPIQKGAVTCSCGTKMTNIENTLKESTVKCFECGDEYHPLEMHNGECKYCYMAAIGAGGSIVSEGNTPKERKFWCVDTAKEWPLACSILDKAGVVVSVTPKEVKREEKKTKITDYIGGMKDE